jgi:hypothetical protein
MTRMHNYNQKRAVGQRSQVSARRSMAPIPARSPDRVPYQLTPAASKNNAFCWMSWTPQIQWRGTKDEADAQAKRNNIMEHKRAAGVDPLYMGGFGANTDRDPMRFSTLNWMKRA